MGDEYRAKVFKSGNSLALRLPKALDLKEGAEMILREERGGFSFVPVDAPRRKIDIAKFVGACPGLRPLARDEFDDPSRAWHVLGVADDPAR